MAHRFFWRRVEMGSDRQHALLWCGFSVLKQSCIKPFLREHNQQLRLFLNDFLSSADDDEE
jgi:hypothetical protein